MNSFKGIYTQNKKNLNKEREENLVCLKWSEFIIELLLDKAKQGDRTAIYILEQGRAYRNELLDGIDDIHD